MPNSRAMELTFGPIVKRVWNVATHMQDSFLNFHYDITTGLPLGPIRAFMSFY